MIIPTSTNQTKDCTVLFEYQETSQERDARLQWEQRWEDAARQEEWFGQLFDLLIQARNLKDEEARQQAIDMVAIAASKDQSNK